MMMADTQTKTAARGLGFIPTLLLASLAALFVYLYIGADNRYGASIGEATATSSDTATLADADPAAPKQARPAELQPLEPGAAGNMSAAAKAALAGPKVRIAPQETTAAAAGSESESDSSEAPATASAQPAVTSTESQPVTPPVSKPSPIAAVKPSMPTTARPASEKCGCNGHCSNAPHCEATDEPGGSTGICACGGAKQKADIAGIAASRGQYCTIGG